MLNKDLFQAANAEALANLSQALKSDDTEAATKAMEKFGENIANIIHEEAEQLKGNNDAAILASRGVRQLTGEERTFYTELGEAMRAGNPKQALVNIDKAIPQTIIDTVIEDMQNAHPLISVINFINCQGAIKMIVNADNIDLATWGALTTKISTELAGKIDVMDMTLAKLSAFIPVSKDMLDLGPSWLDNYVRIILSEACAGGLELGILKGTGKNQPIGMCKNLDGSVTQGEYADKTKVKLLSFDPVEYCAIIADLAKKPNEAGYRAVPSVAFICNPVDYIAKIVPCTTVRDSAGNYKNNIFPYPTTPIQSIALDEGEAIIGLPEKYFMGIGAGKSGKIEYSDEYQFLDDNRVYLIKMYAMGKPKDNNAFKYLDISKLKPISIKVEVTNTEDNPVNTKAKASA